MPPTHSFLRAGLGFIAVAGIVAAASSCVVKTASSVECGAEQRPSVDCSNEISYQGYKADGGFGILNLVSGGAKFQEVALRRIDEETERFLAMQTHLCRDYNACALDKDTYAAQSSELRQHLSKVGTLVGKVKSAPSEDDKLIALGELYEHSVPPEKRVEEVALKLALEAELPAGGGAFTVRPGMPLPTGARAWAWVEVTPEAYVYIFQKTQNGSVSVLFPDERIGTKNPLAGNLRVRIPNAPIAFKLNDKDVGTEHVYFAASRTPLASLDAALSRVREGKVTSVDDDNLLKGFTALPPSGASSGGSKCRAFELDVPAGSAGCTRARGLELDVSAGFGEGGSIGAITEPGDSLIVYSFAFDHVTEGAYASAMERYKGQPARARGGVILEKGSRTRGGVILEKGSRDDAPPGSKPPSVKRGGVILE
ncbi:DUF4384 domain-containing protein [Polyangium aurulentum]|uniref:DUF4384 domain-containing protein n=1 Tax=Polyangium aurulentum TaxID=2567896 RepID=UPI0010ADB386|nr:DUF4384 domain-containing protein [Polyangium aurulentum]UQA60883.1 DUF4384 domain-containing protein [Polyangium aurulentum]